MAQKSINLKIYGQVQGVFFRKSAKDVADRLGIVGWIRNNRDGSVESVVTGLEKSLEEYIAWCRKGPGLAAVEKVETEGLVEEEEFDSFEII